MKKKAKLGFFSKFTHDSSMTGSKIWAYVDDFGKAQGRYTSSPLSDCCRPRVGPMRANSEMAMFCTCYSRLASVS